MNDQDWKAASPEQKLDYLRTWLDRADNMFVRIGERLLKVEKEIADLRVASTDGSEGTP